MRESDHQFLPVEIVNESTESWLGDILRPVRLAYRWLNADGNMVVEGERSALPIGGVMPQQRLQGNISIFAPQVPGSYVLQITIVQEMVGWFDKLGSTFNPHTMDVNVTN